MSSGRDFFGRGGLIATLLLAAYLLVLGGLLLGPLVPVLVLLAGALGWAVLGLLRNPARTDRLADRLKALVRRTRTSPPPVAGPGNGGNSVTGLRNLVPARVVRHRPVPPHSEPPAIRMIPGRSWRSPGSMARDFVVLGLAGLGLFVVGSVLPDWPFLTWLGEVLSILGILGMLIASGVLYSYWRDRM